MVTFDTRQSIPYRSSIVLLATGNGRLQRHMQSRAFGRFLDTLKPNRKPYHFALALDEPCQFRRTWSFEAKSRIVWLSGGRFMHDHITRTYHLFACLEIAQPRMF